MVAVLGVDVDAALLSSWRRWMAPERQPFFFKSRGRAASGDSVHEISAELRDTYALWNVDRSCDVLWLDEPEFFGMPRSRRAKLVRSQVDLGRGAVPVVRRWLDVLDAATLKTLADGHRFVWWPSLIPDEAEDILARIVGMGQLPSRHREVMASTWSRCSAVLPAAREMAGTYPRSSGPNCFATVIAASGVVEAADAWMLQEPFLDWLRTQCRPGGVDADPGTVLVWFDENGLPVHAAVTIGDGWALEKASQSWSTPRAVLPVSDVIRMNRSLGQRLQRHRIR